MKQEDIIYINYPAKSVVRGVGLVLNTHPLRRYTARTEDAIVSVQPSIEVNSIESIRRRAQTIRAASIHHFMEDLLKDLSLRPYKIQLIQELKPNDHKARRMFGVWAQNELATDTDSH